MAIRSLRIFLLISLTISACNESNQERKTEQVPDLVVNSQSGWGGDFILHILKSEIKDSFHIYTVVSIDNRVPIGFKLEVPIITGKFGEGIRFKSLGDTSDYFLKTLSSIYQVKLENDAKFIKLLSCNYANLNDLTY